METVGKRGWPPQPTQVFHGGDPVAGGGDSIVRKKRKLLILFLQLEPGYRGNEGLEH